MSHTLGDCKVAPAGIEFVPRLRAVKARMKRLRKISKASRRRNRK